jgi:transposase
MGKRVEKVNPQRKRVRFTREFKLEAVKLLKLGQKLATELAMELGVARNQFYKWQTQLQRKGEAAFPSSGAKLVSEQSEIERLKRELKQVSEERDILRKAAQHFAKELP